MPLDGVTLVALHAPERDQKRPRLLSPHDARIACIAVAQKKWHGEEQYSQFGAADCRLRSRYGVRPARRMTPLLYPSLHCL